MRRWTGVCERKTPGGTLRGDADGSGGVLDAVLITGDYFTRSVEIAALETHLKGTPPQREAILSMVRGFDGEGIYRVDARELAEIVLEAASGPRKGDSRIALGGS